MKQENLKVYKEFGSRIASIRDNNGISQQELANKLGIAQSTLAGYETGVRKVPLDTIRTISNALNIDADYLIHGHSKTLNSRQQILWEHYREADPITRKNVDKLLDMPED